MRRLPVILLFLICMGGTWLQAQPVPPLVLAAAQSMMANLEGDVPRFIRQVHPGTGLSYYESARTIHPDRAFSQRTLQRSWKSKRKDITVISEHDESDRYVTNVVGFLQEQLRKGNFRTSTDVRYNIQSLPYSTDVFRKAGPGEALVSFHRTDPTTELGWSCLVLRLRKSGRNYYLSGIDYLYWTP